MLIFIKFLILFVFNCGNNVSNDNKGNKKAPLSSLFIYQDRENGEFKELKPNSILSSNIRIIFNKEAKEYKEANKKEDMFSELYFIAFEIDEDGKKEPAYVAYNERNEIILNKNGKYLIYAVNNYHAHIMSSTEGDEKDPKIEVSINKYDELPILFQLENETFSDLPLLSPPKITIIKNPSSLEAKKINVRINDELIDIQKLPASIFLKEGFLSQHKISIEWLENFENEGSFREREFITYSRGEEIIIEGKIKEKEVKRRFLKDQHIQLNEEFKIEYINFNFEGNLEIINKYYSKEKDTYIEEEIFKGLIEKGKRIKINSDNLKDELLIKINEREVTLGVGLRYNTELLLNGKELIDYDIIKEEEILENTELILRETNNLDLGNISLIYRTNSYMLGNIKMEFKKEDNSYKLNLLKTLEEIRKNSKEKFLLLEIEDEFHNYFSIAIELKNNPTNEEQ